MTLGHACCTCPLLLDVPIIILTLKAKAPICSANYQICPWEFLYTFGIQIMHLWSKLCICASHTEHIRESNRYILSWTWARTQVLETEWKTMTIRMSTFKKGTGLRMTVITAEGHSWQLASPTLLAAGGKSSLDLVGALVCHPFQQPILFRWMQKGGSESLVAMM